MLGFIGLGHMGEPMATNLALARGEDLTVWSRSTSAYLALERAGARTAATVDEVFAASETVLLMLAGAEAVDDVLRRDAPERFRTLVRGHTVVHMGTTRPDYSLDLGRALHAAEARYVEAPVSGSRTPALAGELIAMVAGEPAAVTHVEPMLEPMCAKVFRCGAAPKALRMKLAVNLFLIVQVVGLAESVNLARRAGLDLAVFRDVLDSGPMASAVSRIKLAKMVDGDHAPQAALADVLYNAVLVGEAVGEAATTGPLIEVCRRLLAEGVDLGHGLDDMSAVISAWG